MKGAELYDLCIATCRRFATGRDRRAGYPLVGLTYVNSHKAPMTGTSVADSLIMRNLTRFLWLGMCRLMGKNTPKGRQYYILSDVLYIAYFATG